MEKANDLVNCGYIYVLRNDRENAAQDSIKLEQRPSIRTVQVNFLAVSVALALLPVSARCWQKIDYAAGEVEKMLP